MTAARSRCESRPHRVLVCVQHTCCHPPSPQSAPAPSGYMCSGCCRGENGHKAARGVPPSLPLALTACPASCPGKSGSPCGTLHLRPKAAARTCECLQACAFDGTASVERARESQHYEGTACLTPTVAQCDTQSAGQMGRRTGEVRWALAEHVPSAERRGVRKSGRGERVEMR